MIHPHYKRINAIDRRTLLYTDCIHMKASFVATILTLALALPFAAGAQSTGLSQAIRAEILKDPRSSSIPAAQVDAMVASLAQAASQQGVTAADITWRPAEAKSNGSKPLDCDFLCSINAIFGFGGNDFTIPIGLGVTSALLILFISMMLHRHHKHGIHPTIESIHTHA